MRCHRVAGLVVVGAFLCSSCSDEPARTSVLPTAPTQASVTTGVAVSGKVYDTGSRVIAGARVEVVNGPNAGQSVITTGDGGFNISGAFDVDTEFRASKDGHEAAMKKMSPYCERCNPHHWMYFALALPVPPVNVAGDYTFTVTADSTCATLPEHARQRTYTTMIAATASQPTRLNTSFFSTASGANLLTNVAWEGLWFSVAADYVELVMGDLHGQPGLVEQTDANAYFNVGGIGSTTLGAGGVSTFTMALDADIVHCELRPGVTPLGQDGRFECPSSAVVKSVCRSRNHQVTFTRR